MPVGHFGIPIFLKSLGFQENRDNLGSYGQVECDTHSRDTCVEIPLYFHRIDQISNKKSIKVLRQF